MFPTYAAFAQEIVLEDKAKQKSVEVYISESGEVTVKHIIEKSSTTRQLELISGTRSDIQFAQDLAMTLYCCCLLMTT